MSLLLALLLLVPVQVFAAGQYTVRGRVVDAKTGEALEGAVISLDNLWAMAYDGGEFRIDGVQPGKYSAKVILLGYVTKELDIEVTGNIDKLTVKLSATSLALDEVVVTAKRPKDGSGTTYNIGREALEHMQISNLADMSALMPGGKTANPDLTVASSFSLRAGSTQAGNAAFSTAVEVDGVRLGGNAGFGAMGGVDTRSIGVDNVDYVEVVTGVPSAEYGDLGSGMVKIHTKRGYTPYRFSFSVNPRTYQASVSKGYNLQGNAGVVNVNAEWARAVKNLVSPYESFTRRSIGAVYSNTLHGNVRVEAGMTGTLGGMNSEDDPDVFTGQYSKENAGGVRANASVTWLANTAWVTNLKFESSLNYEDNRTHEHLFNSSAVELPAVHATQEGLFKADMLPAGQYFSDRVVDSKEMDVAAALKYTWDKRWNGQKSNLKAGVQWNANGNVGKGEYYEDPALAHNGYRERPYSDYPFMHTVSAYMEEDFALSCGLELIAGLRMDNIFIDGSQYSHPSSLSPRLNAKWKLGENLTLRGGWGVSQKMPSFYILFPMQEYRDILVGQDYTYYTVPYTMEFNPDLKWQRHENSELGIETVLAGTEISLVGFYNLTTNPYKYTYTYQVVTVPRPTGDDRTFVANKRQDNGEPVRRAGVELTMDFPEIKALRTSLRADASYTWTKTDDETPNYFYNTGWSHTTVQNRSYQYVGIYPNGGNGNLMVKGSTTGSLDANLMSITHIPEARLIISCKVEASLLKYSRNIPTAGTDVLYPVAYMNADDDPVVVHEFTQADRDNDEFKGLVRTPSNSYLFDDDGYGAYASANLSVTKEIGERISLSFFANNFTNARPYVKSKATGVGAIFTPSFYYGLSCRIEL